MRDLQQEFNSAIIIITHDLGVVAELADDILVMYGGRASSTARVEDVFQRPEHPYTWGLLGSMPRLDREPTDAAACRSGHAAVADQPAVRAAPSTRAAPTPSRTGGRSVHRACRSCSRPTAGTRSRCHLPARSAQQIWNDEIRPTLERDGSSTR